jgi:hypothetical protein
MKLKPIIIYRSRTDYQEIISWCQETFKHSGVQNGEFVVYENGSNSVKVELTPYTEEAATLMTLRWV